MKVGIDFDNTIVCYDEAFHRAALERALIPPWLAATKEDVRDYLREVGREDDWTDLQGHVYGARMDTVLTFSGVAACVKGLKARGIQVAIISHKTLYPYRGPRYNLHEAARNWLATSGFLQETGLTMDQVFFELTKDEKLARIGAEGCTHFIDDLHELLTHEGFPATTVRMLFAPGARKDSRGVLTFRSWEEIARYLRSADAE